MEGQPVVITVEALNDEDFSIPSDYLTDQAVVQVEPHTPTSAPMRGESGTTETSIEILITEITANGGASITEYVIELECDSNPGLWFEQTNV